MTDRAVNEIGTELVGDDHEVTMEDMIQFFNEQPVHQDSGDQEKLLVENMIEETSDLHDTLGEIEHIMLDDHMSSSELYEGIGGQEAEVPIE